VAVFNNSKHWFDH